MPLDPVMQQLLDQVPTVPAGPLDYPAVRKMAASFIPMLAPPESLSPVAGVKELQIEGKGGAVPLRVYRPVGEAVGILHYIHGGGWCIGDLNTVDHTARRLCDGLSMVIVTSSYRLAPENQFPAGYDDCILAARWVQAHRADLGGQDLATVIAGDSAGGNLVAAIVQELRNTGEQTFDVQLLLYPAVDLRDSAADYPSRLRNADPTLNAEQMSVYNADYAGSADRSDPRISPIAAEDLTGLPPALVVVQSVDPLRDEAVAYADRLRDADVKTEVIEFDNLTHGFVHFSAIVPAAAKATDEVMEHLRSMLAYREPRTHRTV